MAEGFLDSVYRRKVVQWTLAYLALAWALAQGTTYLVTLFHGSERLAQAATLLLIAAIPFVAVLAWFHGDRGAQRVSWPELAILGTLGALLAFAAVYWTTRQDGGVERTETVVAGTGISNDRPVAAPPKPSIAVLPFENRSAKPDDEFFVEGIQDDILTQLSKLGSLKVISRTSVTRYRNSELPISEIARQLGVATVLEGGVQRGGDRVRINIQLIDASTDAHVWADTFDRDLTAANIFAIQSEIAQAVAAALEARLTAGEKARVEAVPTLNLEAWEAYQLGRQRQVRRTGESTNDAERLYRRAIALDDTFALAYAALASVLVKQTEYSDRSPAQVLAEADQMASRAQQLSPQLAEAWAARGLVALNRNDRANAEAMLRRAIGLNPNYAQAEHWLGMTMRDQGHFTQWVDHARRAVELDPLSAHFNFMLGAALESVGAFDDAASRYRRAMDIDPESPGAVDALAMLEGYVRSHFNVAVPLEERAKALDPRSSQYPIGMAVMLFDLGDTDGALQLIRSATTQWPEDWLVNALAGAIVGALGDSKSAAKYAHVVTQTYPDEMMAHRALRDADLRDGGMDAAVARLGKAFPGLYGSAPTVNAGDYWAAIDLAHVLSLAGAEPARIEALLKASESCIQSMPRRGGRGYQLADVQIHAIRGDKQHALAALAEAVRDGWRGPVWRYYRDQDPILAPLRHEAAFREAFAAIERDLNRQRAELTLARTQ